MRPTSYISIITVTPLPLLTPTHTCSFPPLQGQPLHWHLRFLSPSIITPSRFYAFHFHLFTASFCSVCKLKPVPSLKVTSLDLASTFSYCFCLLPFWDKFLYQWPTLPYFPFMLQCTASVRTTKGLIVLQSKRHSSALFTLYTNAIYTADHLVLTALLPWLLWHCSFQCLLMLLCSLISRWASPSLSSCYSSGSPDPFESLKAWTFLPHKKDQCSM